MEGYYYYLTKSDRGWSASKVFNSDRERPISVDKKVHDECDAKHFLHHQFSGVKQGEEDYQRADLKLIALGEVKTIIPQNGNKPFEVFIPKKYFPLGKPEIVSLDLEQKKFLVKFQAYYIKRIWSGYGKHSRSTDYPEEFKVVDCQEFSTDEFGYLLKLFEIGKNSSGYSLESAEKAIKIHYENLWSLYYQEIKEISKDKILLEISLRNLLDEKKQKSLNLWIGLEDGLDIKSGPEFSSYDFALIFNRQTLKDLAFKEGIIISNIENHEFRIGYSSALLGKNDFYCAEVGEDIVSVHEYKTHEYVAEVDVRREQYKIYRKVFFKGRFVGEWVSSESSREYLILTDPEQAQKDWIKEWFYYKNN